MMTRSQTGILAAALVALLAPWSPAHAQNSCTAAKAKVAGKAAAGLLGCYGKAANTAIAIDPLCTQKWRDKFSTTSIKSDAKQDPTKAETVCPGGAGDQIAVQQIIDAHTDQVARQLNDEYPTFTTPSKCAAKKMKCAGKADSGLLKCYAKALNAGPAANVGTAVETIAPGCVAKAVQKLTDCYAKLDVKQNPFHPESVCPQGSGDQGTFQMVNAFVGDVVGFYAEKLDSHRCTGNSATTCTTNADCSVAGGTCEYFFGTNLPIAAGGISTCVVNTFLGTISGTADVATGSSAGVATVLSRIYSGPLLGEPCAVCSGDPIPNDGHKGGTCSHGMNSGQPCDGNGTNLTFGTTSLDCPPLAGGLIGQLTVDLTNTTGNETKTLTAGSPNCRHVGFTSLKCFCDTCDNAAATPCSTDADCVAVGATTCGGKRCKTGTNDGAPCAATSECPGGTCLVPGAPTAANECDDATCTADGGNEGTCAGGPVEQFCGPHETFRGCITDGDCFFSGDTCSIAKNRDCYTDNGVIGATIAASGNADPGSAHAADPTFGALYCLGVTVSNAVNTAAGFPGLGRLELRGHAVDDGNATTCPTKFTFDPTSQDGILDSGWTGLAHDSTVVSQGLVTVAITGCTNASPPCGVCSYTGPIPN